ncbi:chondroitin sulfate synthase 2 isoform X2 [Bacillus rossius redtenbacheri]|uniref:chondroitin sulfate synthase 2 isoform X2 n=1 Tax=Bacillus rossius redtenbacheri TaxID=93214 RepID=UPI002FDC8223
MVILNATISYVKQIYEGRFQFKKFLRGYRRFDPARGLDYIMDLVWIDTLNAEVTHKRIEVCKPLGKTELVPMPYIMENTRVNMILPVTAGDRQLTKKFMEHYTSVCMEKHDKTFLMLVLLYDPIDPHKGAKDDVFLDIKQLALSLSNRYKRDGSRIAWISISIPSSQKDNTVLLEFAVADLVVKKFSQDSLILMCEPNMDIRQDYLNRVRMNTILQRQVFSPIPFTEFNPDVTYTFIPSRSRESDINKNYGHYDVHATRHISFYIKDYVTSRKLSESIIPIIRTDRDISTTFLRYQNAYRNASNNFISSIYSMFISYSNVHILRSVEPSLRLRYVDKSCSGLVLARNVVYDKCRQTKELSLGTRSQLAKVILDYQSLAVSKMNA